MAEDINMDSFIRDTLNSFQRVRDKSFTPIQQTIVSKTSTNIVSPPRPATLESFTGGEVLQEGGGVSGTFLVSHRLGEDGTVVGIDVTAGSYHILNTNTDVPAKSGDGKYVYAVIEHSTAGVFKEFKIEISQTSKDPVNLDAQDEYIQFSNILLAEGMVVGGKPVMVQRRVGNLSLVHQIVNGKLCLWAYSSGGTSL
ncbi:MAG: hypothetical protein ACK5H0_10375 [Bacteroidota bacterium]|jgi:hypothetical protein